MIYGLSGLFIHACAQKISGTVVLVATGCEVAGFRGQGRHLKTNHYLTVNTTGQLRLQNLYINTDYWPFAQIQELQYFHWFIRTCQQTANTLIQHITYQRQRKNIKKIELQVQLQDYLETKHDNITFTSINCMQILKGTTLL